MSRLDSFIRRLEAQRGCLNHCASLIAEVDGPILEVGLGNGRTFDHLREIFPSREIFVFERKVMAHPDSVPDAGHLFLGPIEKTLPEAVRRFAGEVALIHADLGSGRPEIDRRTAATLSRHIPRLLAAQGVVLSDLTLQIAGAEALALPVGVAPGRYGIHRLAG
jgi:hypothetical protein